MKSSNSQQDIDKMAFWYFNNYMVYFYKFLEDENGKNDENQNPEESATKQFSTSMSNAKAMMKNQSLGGIKKPKK